MISVQKHQTTNKVILTDPYDEIPREMGPVQQVAGSSPAGQ